MARALLSEEIANKIKQLIEKQYKPGDKIPTEMELADFLGVSRTTIREAVKILCSSHILVIKRGNGTFVCENPGVPADPLGVKALDEQKVKDDLFVFVVFFYLSTSPQRSLLPFPLLFCRKLR